MRSALGLEAGKTYVNARGDFIKLVKRHIKPSSWGKPRKVGQRYDYHWPDGHSVGHYRVVGLGKKGYEIRWSNGQLLWIQYGCPLNLDAILVG